MREFRWPRTTRLQVQLHTVTLTLTDQPACLWAKHRVAPFHRAQLSPLQQPSACSHNMIGSAALVSSHSTHSRRFMRCIGSAPIEAVRRPSVPCAQRPHLAVPHSGAMPWRTVQEHQRHAKSTTIQPVQPATTPCCARRWLHELGMPAPMLKHSRASFPFGRKVEGTRPSRACALTRRGRWSPLRS